MDRAAKARKRTAGGGPGRRAVVASALGWMCGAICLGVVSAPVRPAAAVEPAPVLSVRVQPSQPGFIEGEPILVRISFANPSTGGSGTGIFLPAVLGSVAFEVEGLLGHYPPPGVFRTRPTGLRLGRADAALPQVPSDRIPAPGHLRPGERVRTAWELLSDGRAAPGGYRVRARLVTDAGLSYSPWAAFTVFPLTGAERAAHAACLRIRSEASAERRLAEGRAFLRSYPNSRFAGAVRREIVLAAHAIGDWGTAATVGRQILVLLREPMEHTERTAVAVATVESLWKLGRHAEARLLLNSLDPYDVDLILERLRIPPF